MNEKKIAVMGCFRSGTNFAKTLLEHNYNCKVRNDILGWKHGYLPIISPDSEATYSVDYDKAFFITKNPFSFLVSLFNYHREVQRNLIAPNVFKEFLRSRITIFDQAQNDSVQYRFANPIELWNSMNWNYSSHSDFIHIRYDKLIRDPETICAKAAAKMGLVRTSENFFSPSKKVKRINDSEKLSSKKDYLSEKDFNKNHYLDNQYMDTYDAADKEFVMQQIDPQLSHKLGYNEIITQLLK